MRPYGATGRLKSFVVGFSKAAAKVSGVRVIAAEVLIHLPLAIASAVNPHVGLLVEAKDLH